MRTPLFETPHFEPNPEPAQTRSEELLDDFNNSNFKLLPGCFDIQVLTDFLVASSDDTRLLLLRIELVRQQLTCLDDFDIQGRDWNHTQDIEHGDIGLQFSDLPVADFDGHERVHCKSVRSSNRMIKDGYLPP